MQPALLEVDTFASNAPPFIHLSGSNTEDALLSLIASGDREAMGSLYDTHSKVVYAVALRILRDPAAAEDVLQDVFMRIWLKPASFIAVRGCLVGWLVVISRNRAIDVLRSRKPTDSVDDIPLRARNNVALEVEQSVMAARAKRLISDLPKVQREALEMAFLKGFSHAEIAKALTIPLGTIKTRIRTALQTLRDALRAPSSSNLRQKSIEAVKP